ncbi:MAG: hypothetical protein K2J81_08145 [Treponemataceae bacterium]|nr:hypothetical protein [Treponemataceae bacterium]
MSYLYYGVKRKKRQAVFFSESVFSLIANAEQGSLNIEQELLDIEQHSLDVEQASLDVEQRSLDVEQASLDIEQRLLDVEQASLDIEQGSLDVAQRSLDVEQGSLDIKQAFPTARHAPPSTAKRGLGAAPQAVLGKGEGLGEGKPRFRVEGFPSPKKVCPLPSGKKNFPEKKTIFYHKNLYLSRQRDHRQTCQERHGGNGRRGTPASPDIFVALHFSPISAIMQYGNTQHF